MPTNPSIRQKNKRIVKKQHKKLTDDRKTAIPLIFVYDLTWLDLVCPVKSRAKATIDDWWSCFVCAGGREGGRRQLVVVREHFQARN